MRTNYFRLIVSVGMVLAFGTTIAAQKIDYSAVQQIFNENCTASCHTIADNSNGLNLMQTSVNDSTSYLNLYFDRSDVHNDSNYYKVMPGNPYKSTLFRMFQNDLAGDQVLTTAEQIDGHASVNLTNIQAETIRQWIIYGAKWETVDLDIEMIKEYYNEGGLTAYDPQNPPPKPSEEEGIQMHIGPLFLAPSSANTFSDVQFFTQNALNISDAIDVHKIEAFIGNSHHCNIDKLKDKLAVDEVPFGLISKNNYDHSLSRMVNAFQFSETVETPQGTAFKWGANSKLMINPHLVNYSQSSILLNDIYFNIYFEEQDDAINEIFMQVHGNRDIAIPNSNVPFIKTDIIDFKEKVNHIWRFTSHTHSRGQSFDATINVADVDLGFPIYSASRAGGVPGCLDIGYDYQHPPFRVFEPFLQLESGDQLFEEAVYLNNTNDTIYWGPNFNSEMFGMLIYYVKDWNGEFQAVQDIENCQEVGIENSTNSSIDFYPNPVSDMLNISESLQQHDKIEIFNLQGEHVYNQNENATKIDLTLLHDGFHIIRLSFKGKAQGSQKFLKINAQ